MVLTAVVDGLGKPGDLVSVKPAYAQNFLLSKGLGKLATPAMLKEISEQVAADKASKAAGLAEAEEKKKTIEVHPHPAHPPHFPFCFLRHWYCRKCYDQASRAHTVGRSGLNLEHGTMRVT